MLPSLFEKIKADIKKKALKCAPAEGLVLWHRGNVEGGTQMSGARKFTGRIDQTTARFKFCWRSHLQQQQKKNLISSHFPVPRARPLLAQPNSLPCSLAKWGCLVSAVPEHEERAPRVLLGARSSWAGAATNS